MVDVLTNSEEAIKQLSAWQSALEAATTERIQEGKDSKTVADQNSPEYLITLEWENLPQQIQETVQKVRPSLMLWLEKPNLVLENQWLYVNKKKILCRVLLIKK